MNSKSLSNDLFATRWKKKIIFIGLWLMGAGVFIATVGALGFLIKVRFLSTKTISKSAATHASVAPGALHPKAAPEFSVSLEIRGVSVPLVDRSATKVAYAQFSVVLDCPSEQAKESLHIHRAKLMDILFETGAKFYLEDFQGPKGFSDFKEALLKAYRIEFENFAPRQVSIQDWFLGS